MRGVKYKDLINILDFIYQGQVNIPQDNLEGFLSVAGDLQIKGMYKENESNNNLIFGL